MDFNNQNYPLRYSQGRGYFQPFNQPSKIDRIEEGVNKMDRIIELIKRVGLPICVAIVVIYAVYRIFA